MGEGLKKSPFIHITGLITTPPPLHFGRTWTAPVALLTITSAISSHYALVKLKGVVTAVL